MFKISHASTMRGIFLPFTALRSCCWIWSQRYGSYTANKILKDNTAHTEA